MSRLAKVHKDRQFRRKGRASIRNNKVGGSEGEKSSKAEDREEARTEKEKDGMY